MAFHHRNLLNESIEDSITSFCAPYCQPEKNQLGLCPLTCISFCYPTCHRPFLAAIPPHPSDYPTTVTTTTTTAFDDHRHPDDRHYISSRFLAMSLAVLVVGFFFFFCYSVCRFCSAWLNSRNEASEEHPGEEERRSGEFLDQDLDRSDQVYHPIWYIRRVGLQPSVISSITILKYKKGDGLVEGTTCAVCLNEFQEDETLRLLPKCDHAFHIPCIDKWLESHTNCPICRADIVIDPVVSPSPVQNVENPGASEEEIQEGVPGNVENQGALEKFQEGVFGNVKNPGALDNIQDCVPESRPELEMENDSESCESTLEDESEGNTRQVSLEELGNGDSKEVIGVLQPLRRSVSCNPLSATHDAFPAQSNKQVNIESFPSIAEKMKRSHSFGVCLKNMQKNI